MSLARQTIGFDWRRYLAAILVVCLTCVLFYLQAGLLLAQWQAITAFERELDADIMVSAKPKGGRRIFRITTVTSSELYFHPNVEYVEPYYAAFVRGRVTMENDGGSTSVSAATINTWPGSMAYPKTLDADARALFDLPGYVLISRSLADTLALSVGSRFTFRNRSLTVAGVYSSSFDDRVDMLISKSTVALLYPSQVRESGFPNMLLVRVKDKSILQETISELSRWADEREAQAVLPEDHILDMSFYVLQASSNLRSVFLVAFFVIAIAVVITNQALRSAITTLSTQFGTLRALGVGRRVMVSLTMEIALWVGILGAMSAMSLGLMLQAVFSYLGLSMLINWHLIALASGSAILIALIAGSLCIRFALSVKPMELLR